MKRMWLVECDKSDCVNTGYDIGIIRRRDGYYYLIAEYISRWQGSYCGREYIYNQAFTTIADAKQWVDGVKTDEFEERLSYVSGELYASCGCSCGQECRGWSIYKTGKIIQ